MKWIGLRDESTTKTMDGSKQLRPHAISVPSLFFDGACQNGIMGCGAWIKLSSSDRFHISWNAGPGSNTRVELLALWSGLFVAHNPGIQNIHIYGDSKTIIHVINNDSSLLIPIAQGWIRRTKSLWHKLGKPSMSHIFRELNTKVDGLSKRGISMDFGSMKIIK